MGLITSSAPRRAVRNSFVHHMFHRRKAAADFSHFAADIASPFDLGNGLGNAYPVPANSRFAVSIDQPTNEGDIGYDVNTQSVRGPGGAADEIQLLVWEEEGSTLSVQSNVPGNVTLYVLDEWNRPFAVATGVAV